jgi:hypothetical protein
MNAAYALIILLFGLWGTAVLMLTLADTIQRRRFESRDELAAWRDKVEAMRRLTDEDGAA